MTMQGFTMRGFCIAPSSRRQLLRNAVTLGTSLMVARAAPAIAAPASAATAAARQDAKIGKNQPMPEIMHLIKIRAAQDKVYQAVATPEGLRNWWTRDVALDPQVGGTGEFGFYGHRMVIKVKVAGLNPSGHVAWDSVSSTGGAFDGTAISFDLKSEDGITPLLFAHRGFKAGADNIASATTRWGFYLLSLKRYLETGKGMPNPEDTELIR
jgi:hypothetical protein